MRLNRDFQEFVAALSSRDVRFLIVGGYAVAAHGHPRYTKDLDIWVWADPRNAESILESLNDFGLGGLELQASDFVEPNAVVQLGFEPHRIDILTSVTGLSFDEAYPNRQMLSIGDITAPFISLDDLVKNKLATGRTQDLADAEALRTE
ncbi:MAG: nucleotidyltransferase [Ilumatobacteraceae bacterium]